MTRNLIDMLFYGSTIILLLLAGLILLMWSKKVWSKAKKDNNYSRGRIFIFMIPGILLMIAVLIPMFYAVSLRKADNHCVAMFAQPQPDFVNKMSQEQLKERQLKEMAQSCPHSNYDDLISRIK
jgi:hypothetical protein